MTPPKIVVKEFDLSLIPPTCSIQRLGPDELPTIINDAKLEQDLGNLFMRMFYVYGAYGLDADALLMQDRALELKKCFRIHAPNKPGIKLLSLVASGEMTDNTPLDFLVENTNIQLDLLYVDQTPTYFLDVPEHDIVFIGIGESTKNNPILDYLNQAVSNWPRPYINLPANVRKCGRVELFNTLRCVQSIHVAEIHIASAASVKYSNNFFLIRPLDSHSGKGFELITSQSKLDEYLLNYSPIQQFYISDYVDYQSNDGYFRKYRIALISGVPYVCHLAISEHWIVHYIAARMDLSVDKRNEEELEMREFNQRFGLRHKEAFASFHKQINLDYVVLDCSETKDGKLLLFEADPGSWIHSTDSVDLFPYKPLVMQRAFDAFKRMLELKIEAFHTNNPD